VTFVRLSTLSGQKGNPRANLCRTYHTHRQQWWEAIAGGHRNELPANSTLLYGLLLLMTHAISYIDAT